MRLALPEKNSSIILKTSVFLRGSALGYVLMEERKRSPVLNGCVFQKKDLCKVSNTLVFNENMLIKHKTIESQKLRNSIECNYKPSFIVTNLKLYKTFEKMNFSEGSKKMLSIPNAGGNSVISEVISYEIIKSAFGAIFLKTEMEIEYFPFGSKITDYSVMINNKKIGVSVTRAMHYKGDEHFTLENAMFLLKKKLNGVFWSTENVIKRDKWEKQILHIFCQSNKTAKKVKEAYQKLKSEYRGNTIVLISIIDHNDLFFEKKCFLNKLNLL
jgi:hypothetical protein